MLFRSFAFLKYNQNKKSEQNDNLSLRHCVESIDIWSISGPYFPSFGLNTERYGLPLCIQSECGKTRTRKTPKTDTFQAVRTS